MIIKEVDKVEEAIECDKLLTKLINNEKKYNKNIKDNYIVNNYFENLYTKNNNILYIALEENKIIGYIYVRIITSDNGPEIEHESLIDGLYVLEEYRNNGVATSLIEKAKKWSISKGVKYISLNALCKNDNALSLYKKEGFNDFSLNLKCNL